MRLALFAPSSELCANCRGVQALERISELEVIDKLRPASEMPGSSERTDNTEYSAVDKVRMNEDNTH